MSWIVTNHGTSNCPKACLPLPTQDAALRCQIFLQQAWEEQKNQSGQSQDNQPKAASRVLDSALVSSSSSPSSTSSSQVQWVEVVPDLCYAVLFPAEASMAAKAYWQHSGEVVSSRRARSTLENLGLSITSTLTPEQHTCHAAHIEQEHEETATTPSCSDASSVSGLLRNRIAALAKVPSPDQVFLAPSGMAAIYTVLRTARRRHMGKQQQHGQQASGGMSIVYGFPYLDTLKLCSRPELCPGGVVFYGKGHSQDLAALEHFLAEHPPGTVSVLFTEVPSNPLLQSPDLYSLRELANQHDFCLAVDDTISNCLNVDLIDSGLADVVCTSLTKLVSGRGDAMGGSCIINHTTSMGQWMQQDLLQHQSHDPAVNGLFGPDALAILRNSADFEERSVRINQTAVVMADWLAHHPDVEQIYYPKYSSSAHLYHQVQRPFHGSSTVEPSGYGGLISIVLRQSQVCHERFYNALNVPKGLSLGTNFTLVCPYTLLAHYFELDFAMQHGVPPNLLRISVGLESVAELQDKFTKAFEQSRRQCDPPEAEESSSSSVARHATG